MQLTLPQYRGLYVPPGLPRIDWANPLTNGLKNVWIFEGGNIPRSLVNGKALSGGTLPSTGMSLAGGGLKYNGTTQFNSGAFSSLSGLNASSIFAFLTPVAVATNVDFFCHARSDAVGGFLVLGTNTTASQPRMIVKDSTTITVNAIGSVGQLANGVPVALGGDAASNNVGSIRLYVNGQIAATSAATTGTFGTTNVTSWGGLSRNEGNSGFSNCIVHLSAEWGRQLSPEEHFELGENPTSFLIYPEDEMLYEWAGGSRFAVDSRCPVEVLGVIKRDAASRFESLGGVLRDSNLPEDWITGPLKRETSLPFELLTSSKYDGKLPVEFLGRFQADRGLPLEEVAGIIRDGKALLDTLSGFSRDSKVPLEWLGSTGVIVADSPMPLEILTSVVSQSIARLESLASIADGAPSQSSGGEFGGSFFGGDAYGSGVSSGGSSKQIEILAGVQGDTNSNFEFVNSMGIASCIALLEWAGQVISPANRIFKVPARQKTFKVPPRNKIFVAALN